jgi:2,4-dienoyl-CoA reductase-like NADH-dependent reductase (Old Yellow Enzyme family)
MSKLDEPLTLPSGVVLPHRVALAPLTNTQSHADGILSEDEFRWLTRRAGHFGLVSTCAAFVSEEGHAWKGQLGIARDEHVAGLTRLAMAIRERGSVPFVQLHHAGKKASLAPAKLSTVDEDGVFGASVADLRRVTSDFVRAAERAHRAGFSGVEIHGANGYLFTQFLAPEDNPRRDDYGGSLQGRARLLRETVQAVRAAMPDDFAVGVRISPVDVWIQRGLVLADSVQLARWLAEDGVDYVHLSLSDAAGPAPHGDADVIVATAIREAVPSEVPILAAGGIWTRADAERAEAAGVDVVVLGKVAIVQPDWPELSRQPNFEPPRPPWTRAQLRAVDVGPDLLRYLENFRGLLGD